MTYTLNGREVDLGLDNVRNKEAKLTYLTFVWEFMGSSVDTTMISSGSTP